MANYLKKFQGQYRLKLEIDETTNDFPRNEDGSIEDIDMYIECRNGNKIKTYGHIDNKKVVWLTAYVPSIGRGHNIIDAVKEKGIEFRDLRETDEEVLFKFKAKDIESIAELLKAKTGGASISPTSSKNLPVNKDVEIPTNEITRYKDILKLVDKGDLLIIHRLTNSFLNDILEKKYKKSDKKFQYTLDIKKMRLGRQAKEYIFAKGMFDEYLDYLEKNLKNIQKSTCN